MPELDRFGLTVDPASSAITPSAQSVLAQVVLDRFDL
jgi:hypothetical protein